MHNVLAVCVCETPLNLPILRWLTSLHGFNKTAKHIFGSSQCPLCEYFGFGVKSSNIGHIREPFFQKFLEKRTFYLAKQNCIFWHTRAAFPNAKNETLHFCKQIQFHWLALSGWWHQTKIDRLQWRPKKTLNSCRKTHQYDTNSKQLHHIMHCSNIFEKRNECTEWGEWKK